MKNLSWILRIILSFYPAFFIAAQTPVPGGIVSGTWTTSGSPFYIMGEISIPTGHSLVIEPGVRVEFQGHYKFNVHGSLLAIGTQSDTIMFTINDSTGWHDMTTTDGGWHGIRFGFGTPATDSSRLRYCIFAFGKAIGALTQDKAGGAIAASEYDDIVVSNSVFYMNASLESGGALALSNADITIEANQFWHCKSYNGGAVATTSSSPIIRNNYFVDNHAENSGGGVGLYLNSHSVITANLFAGNFADFGGAIQVEMNCNPTIRNNLIYSNVAYSEGGGVDLEGNCQATFINNTIVGNFALFGGGVDVEVNTSPVFRNTILWDNTAWVDGPQVHLFSEDSDPDFYYCDIEGGTDSIGLWYGGTIYLNYTGTYENNIDADPDFYDEDNYYYLLADGSPCIDAGDPDPEYNDIEDPANPGFALWPSKETIHNDLGVYGGPFPLTYEIITAIEEPVMPLQAASRKSDFRCYPNPASGSINFKFSTFGLQKVTIKIFNLQGREVATVSDRQFPAGEHSVSFNAKALQPGSYICRISGNGKTSAFKLLMVN